MSKTKNREALRDLLAKRVAGLFERDPRVGISARALDELVDEILKLK